MPRIRLTLLVAVLLAIAAPLHAQESKPSRLTIATYNVEWMLDVFDDPYSQDESHKPKPREEIEAVAKAIRKVNPDVVTFCELENEGVLRAMVREFLLDMGYEYIAADRTNSDRGQNLGVISRRPITSLTSHRFQDLPTEEGSTPRRFARDLWRVEIQATPRTSLGLYVVHLKSKLDGPNDPGSNKWRLSEINDARRIIGRELTANPDALLTMMGDFNDTPDSQAITTMMQPFSAKIGSLVDLHAAVAVNKRITYIKEPYRSTIDYILASPALAKCVVKGSAKVLDDEPLLSGSDHAPVVATFELP